VITCTEQSANEVFAVTRDKDKSVWVGHDYSMFCSINDQGIERHKLNENVKAGRWRVKKMYLSVDKMYVMSDG
jgi:hypothetical protein